VNLLLIEDDRHLSQALCTALEARGFACRSARTLEGAELALQAEMPDAILLDLGLPDGDGLDFLPRLRSLTAGPIIVVSARREMSDKIRALNAGADDYVAKPFAIDELDARLRAVLRRAGTGEAPKIWRIGSVTVDLLRRHLVSDTGSATRLTPIEWAILERLLQRAGFVVSVPELSEYVWPGEDARDNAARLRVHITHIRQKLELGADTNSDLETVAGNGYRLTCTSVDS